MSWFRATALILFAAPVWGLEGYVIGAGVEADNEDGTAVTLSADLGIAKETWLSAAVATSRVDLPRGTSIETLYGDIGIDLVPAARYSSRYRVLGRQRRP